MLSILQTIRSPSKRAFQTQFRTVATQAAQKPAGDISNAFVSLSGQKFEPLAPKYADLKSRLIKGYENEIRASWERLLQDLKEEIPQIVELGSKVIPTIEYNDIGAPSQTFNDNFRKRGVAVVRGVVDEAEVLSWKQDLKEYIKNNPQTRGMIP
jgi:hypothetical protein